MIARGQVYLVDLDPVKGREQAGRRPVLVVSSDALNAQPLVVTVVPGTDARNVDRDYPANVRVTSEESGLSRDTVFLCFQVRCLDHARFGEPVGSLPPGRLRQVDEALRKVLGLD